MHKSKSIIALTKALLKSESGISAVILALTMVVVIASAALAVDVGFLASQKARLSNSVDASALAAAREMVLNPANVTSVARQYVLTNDDQAKNIIVNISNAQKTVRVEASQGVDSFFGPFIGYNGKDITSHATARLENIQQIDGGLRPLAVVQQTFIYNQVYVLKEGGGDGSSGNYAAMALGGTGGSVYRDNLTYGYDGTVRVGDIIPTETGNIAGTTHTCVNNLVASCTHSPACTYSHYVNGCPRIVIIPVVDTLDVNGRKSVKVLGFATFFLEGSTSHGGQSDVIGRFITYSMQGQTSTAIADFGTYGIKLIE